MMSVLLYLTPCINLKWLKPNNLIVSCNLALFLFSMFPKTPHIWWTKWNWTGSTRKPRKSKCAWLFVIRTTMTHQQWEDVLWIVFAPGGRGCWAMSGRQNELGGHILAWPRCCCWLCAAFVHTAKGRGLSTASLHVKPCFSAGWFNIDTVWLNISQLTL